MKASVRMRLEEANECLRRLRAELPTKGYDTRAVLGRVLEELSAFGEVRLELRQHLDTDTPMHYNHHDGEDVGEEDTVTNQQLRELEERVRYYATVGEPLTEEDTKAVATALTILRATRPITLHDVLPGSAQAQATR